MAWRSGNPVDWPASVDSAYIIQPIISWDIDVSDFRGRVEQIGGIFDTLTIHSNHAKHGAYRHVRRTAPVFDTVYRLRERLNRRKLLSVRRACQFWLAVYFYVDT